MDSILHVAFQCFAPVSAFAQANTIKHYLFSEYEGFRKASFANRYQVLGSSGMINLSVPIVGGRGFRGSISEAKIANDTAWQRDHWRTLKSCYNRSAYFNHYEAGLRPFYEQRYDRLMNFSLDGFKWVLQQLRVEAQVVVMKQPAERGKQVLLPANRHRLSLTPYPQVFNLPFEQNLSILDLLFNLGPAASAYLATIELPAD